MNAADSSVAIAAFASWHPGHSAARTALGDDARIVAHAALETYAVLTRLPGRFRAGPEYVGEFLQRRFPDEYVSLSPRAFRSTLAALPERGIIGGAVYDALIGAAAAANGAVLLTFDRRAAGTYDRVGARYSLLAPDG